MTTQIKNPGATVGRIERSELRKLSAAEIAEKISSGEICWICHRFEPHTNQECIEAYEALKNENKGRK